MDAGLLHMSVLFKADYAHVRSSSPVITVTRRRSITGCPDNFLRVIEVPSAQVNLVGSTEESSYVRFEIGCEPSPETAGLSLTRNLKYDSAKLREIEYSVASLCRQPTAVEK
jgi:hypothetical protein